MQSFTPSPDEARAYRAALGAFATGVTVVTVDTATGPLGMTANSFTSVSLDPPLILWCPAKASGRHDLLVDPEHFALHVLSQAQENLAVGFSRSGDVFDQCDWARGDHNVPLIADCAARFECQTVDRIDGGDHTILLARVERAAKTEAQPLLFFQGLYGRFGTDTG